MSNDKYIGKKYKVQIEVNMDPLFICSSFIEDNGIEFKSTFIIIDIIEFQNESGVCIGQINKDLNDPEKDEVFKKYLKNRNIDFYKKNSNILIPISLPLLNSLQEFVHD